MSRPRTPPPPEDPSQNGAPLVLVEGEENTTLESLRRVSIESDGELDADDEATVSELTPAPKADDEDERTEVGPPRR